MIILDGTTKSLEVVLEEAINSAQAQWVVDYEVTKNDLTSFVPASDDGVTNATTEVEVVAAPASGYTHKVAFFSLYNADNISHVARVEVSIGGTPRVRWRGTLDQGETLIFNQFRGWTVMGVDGQEKIAQPASNVLSQAGMELSATQRVLRSQLDGIGTILLIDGTAYFVYLGKLLVPKSIKHVELHVTTVGASTQNAEVVLASSPSAPNKAGQVLTKIVHDATLDDLTVGTGVKRNTTPFGGSSQLVPAGTHLWAGIRTAMAGAEPTCRGLGIDMAQGHVLTLAAAGALSGAGPWNGALPAVGTSAVAPDLRAVVD